MEFDYVVVGAGSAGCVVANRLSANPQNRVLLLESGGPDNDPLIHIPLAFMVMLQHRLHSRAFESLPQEHLNNRVLHECRGKVLGGSSSINGMHYCRGAPQNFDEWAQMGNRGWAYSDVLPYFKKSETYEFGESAYRGGSGPLLTTKSRVFNQILLAWLEAGAQAGYPRTDDHNGAHFEGFGIVDCTISGGKRISTAVAYLKPVMDRPNLTVVTHAFATRVLLDGGRAVGVEYQHGKKNPETKRAYAQAEVILSAGALISPQLLMLSGIGDADHLRSVGINAAVQLKGVGQNLHDHANVMLRQACPLPVTDYRLFTTLGKAKIGLQYLFGRKGPGGASNVTVCTYLRSGAPGYDGPDLKFYVLPMMTEVNSAGVMKEDGVTALIILTRPESRGELRLRSADPRAMPLLNARYLSAERDRDAMRRGIRIARDVFLQPAYAPYRGREVLPGAQCSSDADLDAFVRENAGSTYEASGTCKMGSDDLAVVDDRLRVRGVQGLRVIDTSIMPRMVTADTNGPTIMIAEKAADFILDPAA